MKNSTVVVFDLDDTLYNEIDFLKSAYKEISLKIGKVVSVESTVIYNQMLACFYNKENVFEDLINRHNLSISINELLDIYRNHNPKLELSKDRVEVLNELKCRGIALGLLTDGRSQQQRSKIEALKLSTWISEILISGEFGSEKPNANNYKHFENLFGKAKYYYIGDNVKKDFITPNKLGWVTICLKDSGLNIHKQDISLIDKKYLAKYTINKLSKILNIVS
ncbi:HAD-IA family hydrolase [Sabulilitoribacter arenilitoris]|uniref:HAD-IA family hydrolase n=1 Tax=Wocania arenilitoris TaxID=2044858 RepID=A0AAE3EQ13_9FLAO|nr:HAD-IA family hydrolase [Wocania arenilitoris]MCF7569081.1 HAD-IA family hydrolase [Wocania arenilitoris]